MQLVSAGDVLLDTSANLFGLRIRLNVHCIYERRPIVAQQAKISFSFTVYDTTRRTKTSGDKQLLGQPFYDWMMMMMMGKRLAELAGKQERNHEPNGGCRSADYAAATITEQQQMQTNQVTSRIMSRRRD